LKKEATPHAKKKNLCITLGPGEVNDSLVFWDICAQTGAEGRMIDSSEEKVEKKK